MHQQFFSYKKSSIHVTFFGGGTRQLFCFHGFGEDGMSFLPLEKSLVKSYTLIAIDFPFHGNTKWEEGLLMTEEDLINIIRMILRTTHGDGDGPFSMIAFSLGGRIALSLLQKMPARIERVVLLAPDGLHVNFWYWLGTQTWAGNKLFAFTMKNPRWFFQLIKISHKTGLVNKSIMKFAHHYLDNAAIRLLLYQRWTTMRQFTPNLYSIKESIIKYQVPLTLVFGKYDRIILSKRSEDFAKTTSLVNVVILEAGHQLLKEKFADAIALLFAPQ